MAQNPKQYLAGYSELTSSDLAAYLRRSFSSSEEEQAEMFIAAVEVDLARRCNRPFAHELNSEDIIYSEVFDIPNKTFFTSGFPIKSIESIKIGGEDAGLTENTDFYIYDDAVVFENGTFSSRMRRGLEIEYTIEKFWDEDVKLTLLKLAATAWLNAEDGGVSKSEMGFASIRQVMDTESYTKEITSLVNRYRKRLI